MQPTGSDAWTGEEEEEEGEEQGGLLTVPMGLGTVHVGTPAWLLDAHLHTSFASMLLHVLG